MNTIQTVGVIGAGTMGNGIAHVFAQRGYEVRICEVEQRFLARGLETIKRNMEREAAKGKITEEEVIASLKRIEGTLDRRTLASVTSSSKPPANASTQDRSCFVNWMICCQKK